MSDNCLQNGGFSTSKQSIYRKFDVYAKDDSHNWCATELTLAWLLLGQHMSILVLRVTVSEVEGRGEGKFEKY